MLLRQGYGQGGATDAGNDPTHTSGHIDIGWSFVRTRWPRRRSERGWQDCDGGPSRELHALSTVHGHPRLPTVEQQMHLVWEASMYNAPPSCPTKFDDHHLTWVEPRLHTGSGTATETTTLVPRA
jgi:hypothetical protein